MPRRNLLAKVHIAKKELRLTDALYREFLFVWFGRRSAKDLADAELEELLVHFKGLGWLPKPGGGGLPNQLVKQPPPLSGKSRLENPTSSPALASPAQRRIIETLWRNGPGVRKKTLPALLHFLNHYFHIADLDAVRAGQVPAILGAIRKIAHRPYPVKK